MIVKRRIPMNALLKGLFSLLSSGQTTPVYDAVPEDAVYPYITLGAFTCKQNSAKGADIWDTSNQIHIWSDSKGKREINEIADDITTVISSVRINLSSERFGIFEQEVDFFEALQSDDFGYHGVLTLACTIQNLGE
jgi:hypothetical protein